MMSKILLDTHIFIWMVTERKKIQEEIQQLINLASQEQRLYLSSISIWEIVMAFQKNRLKLTMPIRIWIEKAIVTSGIKIFPLTPEILIESCLLPGELHGDPADRMIIATTQIENAILITRDNLILSYAKKGDIQILKG